MKRSIFILSDGTGITAEILASSLISQFNHIEFEKNNVPYIDSLAKAEDVVQRIDEKLMPDGRKPLVFMTLVDPLIRMHIKKAQAHVFDLFGTFIPELEEALNAQAAPLIGQTHGVVNDESYFHRIEAIDYAVAHDDGIKPQGYKRADVILIGVSRCGKTPSCLYMALQYGILAANYPFTEEDMARPCLLESLAEYKHKLFGLTIDIQRLHHIRSERRPNSHYASLEQCRLEIAAVEALYKREKIPYLNSTRYSIEEIATKILATSGLHRKI